MLLKFALITTFLGIIALIFLSQSLILPLTAISEIDNSKLDSFVRIQGKIISVKNYENMALLKISDETANITVIARNKLNISKNDWMDVIGKVVEYKGMLEIEAEQIKTK